MWLYLAHLAFERERELDAYLRTPVLKQAVKFLGDANEIRKTAAKAESKIGADWTRLLKDKKTYSGLSVRDLSQTFGLLPFYEAIYRVCSQHVHAVDATDFIVPVNGDRPGTEIDLTPGGKQVGGVLVLGTRVYLYECSTLNNRLGLTPVKKVTDLLASIKHIAQR